jgi:uncharacterized protein (TIGR01777 family)
MASNLGHEDRRKAGASCLPMKIVLAGGSGQVGTILSQAFHRDGHKVVVLARGPATMPSTVSWDGVSLGSWTRELEGADVLINLAGRSVNCRYHARNRREIMDSRVASTQVLGEAISQATDPPRVWLQASTATIYEHRFDAPNDEITGILGGSEPDAPETWRFSIDVARAWEHAAQEAAPLPRTRLVLLRSAIIMSPERGGAFDMLLRLVRFGLGGSNGDGCQYVSWIHDTDFVRAVYRLIEHDAFSGTVNLAAPQPLPNKDFMRALRQAWGIRVGLPAKKWMLEIGAFFLRTETELILKSRRVVPTLLLQSGFTFQFPHWPEAAQDLCRRWRTR